LTGCRLVFADTTPELLVYPTDREAYGRLTRLLTVGQLRSKKGECQLLWEDFLQAADGQLVVVAPPTRLDAGFETELHRLRAGVKDLWLGAARRYGARDLHGLSRLAALASVVRIPPVATNDV